MRLRLGPAILAALGGGKGMWLGGFSYSSDEGILLYWGFNAYSCRLEGDMEPREERWLPMVKLCAVDTRLLGGGTSSLRRYMHNTQVIYTISLGVIPYNELLQGFAVSAHLTATAKHNWAQKNKMNNWFSPERVLMMNSSILTTNKGQQPIYMLNQAEWEGWTFRPQSCVSVRMRQSRCSIVLQHGLWAWLVLDRTRLSPVVVLSLRTGWNVGP